MAAAAPARRPNTTNVLAGLLVAAVALAVVLFLLVVAPWRSTVTFSVSEVMGTPCPVGGAPACFSVTLTNAGATSSNVRCEVTPAFGDTAAFGLGGSSYTSVAPLEPGQQLSLTLRVDTVPGSVRIYPPSVSCAAI